MWKRLGLLSTGAGEQIRRGTIQPGILFLLRHQRLCMFFLWSPSFLNGNFVCAADYWYRYIYSVGNVNITPTASPWDLLPVELQIKIFAYCGIRDLIPLRLVCRAFCQILTYHEQLISRQYLRQRRHGTLPSPIESERTYTRNPEDDVVLLSDLFPPSKSAKGGHLYTFRYVHSLRRRQKLCSRLCYYVADRVMDRFMQCEQAFVKTMFPSKKDKNALIQRGIASLWFNLTPLM